jgi:hypothetical protein
VESVREAVTTERPRRVRLRRREEGGTTDVIAVGGRASAPHGEGMSDALMNAMSREGADWRLHRAQRRWVPRASASLLLRGESPPPLSQCSCGEKEGGASTCSLHRCGGEGSSTCSLHRCGGCSSTCSVHICLR